jgi:hypothetical protein
MMVGNAEMVTGGIKLNSVDAIYLATVSIYCSVWVAFFIWTPRHFGEGDAVTGQHWTVWVCFALNLILLLASIVLLRRTSFGLWANSLPLYSLRAFVYSSTALVVGCFCISPFSTWLLFMTMLMPFLHADQSHTLGWFLFLPMVLVGCMTVSAVGIASVWTAILIVRPVMRMLALLLPSYFDAISGNRMIDYLEVLIWWLTSALGGAIVWLLVKFIK